MNRLNKKGFTIVELVIVIAVIAILAAVLIPTFSSIIKKANQAADIQAARQMDVALQAESVIETPADIGAVVTILADAGYAAEETLKPITTDHTFYWHKTYNAIVLANEEDANAPVVLYPTEKEELVNSFTADKALTGDNMVLYDLSESYKHVVAKVDTAEKLVNALSKGQSVTLTDDVAVDGATASVETAEGSSVTMDLGGHTLTVNGADESFVKSNGDFTLDGNGGQLIVNGSGYGAALTNAGSGTMTVKNVTITSSVDTNAYAVSNQDYGTLSMQSVTINAKRGCLNVQAGTATVTDCTFTSEIGRIADYEGTAFAIQVKYQGTLKLISGVAVNITSPSPENGKGSAAIFNSTSYGSEGTIEGSDAITTNCDVKVYKW